MLDIVISQIANGLALGMLFVLIALGLSIIFGMLGIVNFTHGAFVALGAHFALSLQLKFGWGAVIFAPLLAGFVGAVVEVVLIRRLYGREPLQALVLTFALAMFCEALLQMIYGAGGQPFNVPPFLSGVVIAGPIFITKYRVAVIILTVCILIAIWALLRLTPFGRVLRAGSRDAQMVELLGIRISAYLTGAFAFGCLLAGTAGVMAAPLWTVTPTMGASAILPAFVIVTIGGLGSYAGAVIAGLLVGVVTALAVQFAPQFSMISMYALMAVVLLVRPRGLLGERWEQFE
ncbi:MAG: branched-chain amino acid ABC transporter permease [Flavobacteriaceae bacterium]